MPINPYFTSHNVGHKSEQDLYSSMMRESIEMTGQEYYYIPRTLSDRFDQLFGEDVLSRFESSAKVVMWLENFNQYGGESEVISKFGLEIRDSASFIIHRDEYTEVVVPIVPSTRDEKLKWRPNEGDLIYVPFSQSLFVIKFVEDEYPGFYQLRKKYVWAIRCELMQLNNEKFNTGIKEIDAVFGTNLNRLNSTIRLEDGFGFMCEDGGSVLLEEYEVSKPVDDIIGFGDDNHVKKEFMQIMDFNEDDPFNELR